MSDDVACCLGDPLRRSASLCPESTAFCTDLQDINRSCLCGRRQNETHLATPQVAAASMLCQAGFAKFALDVQVMAGLNAVHSTLYYTIPYHTRLD